MDRIGTAALNNALWCDAVCRAHGRAGDFLPGLWLNSAEAPRFYPNMVTTSPDGIAEQMAALRDLLGRGLPAGWGVKDSFCRLDLRPLGFRVLFEAEWFHRAPTRPLLDGHRDWTPAWDRIRSEAELAEWERAWARDSAPDSSLPRLFPTALLNETDVTVLVSRQPKGGAILAGAIASRGAGAIGITNVFTPAQEERDYWGALLAAVHDRSGGSAVVGYEPPGFVRTMPEIGLETLGTLRIWAAPASPGPERF